MNRKNFFLSLICLSTLMLGACDVAMMSGGYATWRYFEDPKINLMEKNYAAADYLDQQTKEFVKKYHKVKAVPLQNIDEPVLATEIGRVVVLQSGERFQQLGYRIDLSEVQRPAETQIPHAAAPAVVDPDFVLSGTYERNKGKVDVKLRMIEAKTGRVVGAFDYPLPMSSEIRAISKPEPRIFRTTGHQ